MRLALALPAVGMLLIGCSTDSTPVDVDAVDLIFLSQSEPQAEHMSALYTGRVIVDRAKCTRLDDAGGATVIWPAGYTVAGEKGDLRVLDGNGREVGRLGDTFRIGGGEVPQLNPQLQISYMDRALAAEFCPGIYWIAADVQ